MWLYPWIDTANDGAPVFGERIPVSVETQTGSLEPGLMSGAVFTGTDDIIYGVWENAGSLLITEYDCDSHMFKLLSKIDLGFRLAMAFPI